MHQQGTPSRGKGSCIIPPELFHQKRLPEAGCLHDPSPKFAGAGTLPSYSGARSNLRNNQYALSCRPNRARGKDPVRTGPALSQYQGSRIRTALSLGSPLKLEKQSIRPILPANRAQGKDPVRTGPALSQYQGSRIRTPFSLGSPLKLEKQSIRPILPANRARGKDPVRIGRAHIKGAGSTQVYTLEQSSVIHDRVPGSRESFTTTVK